MEVHTFHSLGILNGINELSELMTADDAPVTFQSLPWKNVLNTEGMHLTAML